MFKRRKTCRRGLRINVRRTIRNAWRIRWRAPDDLGEALIAFRRAIRAHRRLAKLVPRYFDSVVIENERLRREEDRRWMATWKPALEKVYGPGFDELETKEDPPPVLHPEVQREVDRWLTEWDCWMEAGQCAMELYRRRRPHDLMSLSRMARLLEIGFDFKKLACGFDPARPPPEPHNDAAVLADIQRAYGSQCAADAAGAECSPSPASGAESGAVPASVPGTVCQEQMAGENALPSSPPHIPPAAAPLPPASPRCDAWSRWARQLRCQIH